MTDFGKLLLVLLAIAILPTYVYWLALIASNAYFKAKKAHQERVLMELEKGEAHDG